MNVERGVNRRVADKAKKLHVGGGAVENVVIAGPSGRQFNAPVSGARFRRNVESEGVDASDGKHDLNHSGRRFRSQLARDYGKVRRIVDEEVIET